MTDEATDSSPERIGVWLVGARGSVATTTIVGGTAVAAGLAPNTGLTTMQEPLASAELVPLESFVFGGHDIVETPLRMRAERLVDSGVIPPGIPEAVARQLSEIETNIRFGITWNEARTDPRTAVDRIARDIREFRETNNLDRVVVLNLSSTESPVEPHASHNSAEALRQALARKQAVLPPSSMYALAAIENGCAFVDFTPSTGARLPALVDMAVEAGVPLAGSDGKTGETLLKTVLAPAFASRALRIRSWSGYNILGGGDGATLADPLKVQSKLASKSRSLEEILGYPVESPVQIEQIRDMGEWKTAWDHISFEGFLGIRMRMQFTWEGCDSALAAPLLLDLARLVNLAADRGETGFIPELGFFFKDPAGSDEHALYRQFETLCEWALQSIPR